jgi:hypothetical protein
MGEKKNKKKLPIFRDNENSNMQLLTQEKSLVPFKQWFFLSICDVAKVLIIQRKI